VRGGGPLVLGPGWSKWLVPIFFTVVSNPVAAGFVASLNHPGGNITGFTNLEPRVGGKWLEFNPDTAPFSIQPSRLAQAAAESFAMQASVAPVHDPADIEAAVAKLAYEPQDSFTSVHRKLIVDLAAQYTRRVSIPVLHR
jgi:putative ABC transport system substrate-binding protein